MSKEFVKHNVTFIHPDLGIGGAERLIVDAAVGLKARGHNVRIVTGYHNKCRAFPETVDGTLKVVTVGDWFPRSFFGKFIALCAYVKMIYAAMYVKFMAIISEEDRPDVIVCDQVSACIPFTKLRFSLYSQRPRILFYCHFPDQLLTSRDSVLKSWYRTPLDYIEEITTNMADEVVVNSEFTRGIFLSTFKRIKRRPEVMYPSINAKMFDDIMFSKRRIDLHIPDRRFIFLSINRFEPKKNIALAIRTLKKVKTCLEPEEWNDVHLVIAGGYDDRLDSCVSYLKELKEIAETEKVNDHVTFITSPEDDVKVRLLAKCTALLYTPSNEHFGIVPLEAMYMGKPVVAVDSGGPRETVIDNVTGFLCPAIETHFAVSMARLVKEPHLTAALGRAGKQRYLENFSFEAFSKSWDSAINGLFNENPSDNSNHLD